MHEFALAEAVLTSALDAAEKEKLSRITAIRVRIGELQRIKQDIFEFALKEVMPASEPRLAETEITLEIEPARFRCRACERRFALADVGEQGADEAEAIHFIPELAHAFLRCPDCRSPDFEVAEGRGVVIESIEGERPDA
ncbi:MAG: hydrogenase nickel incorporation protein HypA [Planctomycetota bacterium]